MGKVKRLKLWWQQYVKSLLVRDLENFRPLDFCSTEVPKESSMQCFPFYGLKVYQEQKSIQDFKHIIGTVHYWNQMCTNRFISSKMCKWSRTTTVSPHPMLITMNTCAMILNSKKDCRWGGKTSASQSPFHPWNHPQQTTLHKASAICIPKELSEKHKS
jgi:hypothetical protein